MGMAGYAIVLSSVLAATPALAGKCADAKKDDAQASIQSRCGSPDTSYMVHYMQKWIYKNGNGQYDILLFSGGKLVAHAHTHD
jgi:hypothetical protein